VLGSDVLASIARVERRVPGEDPTLLGTGFVIGDGLVLTAKHVVAGRTDLLLTFPDRTPDPATVVDETGASDWAILQSAAAVGRTPLRLRPLPYGPDAMWQTYAYFRKSGGYLRGPIRGTPNAQRMDLRADEAAFGDLTSVEGASGSPVIAHGVVVGIVIIQLSVEKKIVEGSVWGLPIRTVAEEELASATAARHSPRIRLDDEWLPYEAKFHGSLMTPPVQPGLAVLAAQLGVPAGGDLPREIARVLLRRGWLVARVYLMQLALPDVNALCEIAESLWVDQEAARLLNRAVLAAHLQRAAAINIASDTSAGHYVDRADAITTAQDLTWRRRIVRISYRATEWDGKTLVAKARAALTTPIRKTDDLIRTYLSVPPPVLALIATEHPITDELVDELQELETTFPGLRPIVLTGVTMGDAPAPPRHITMVQPELPDGFETDLLARYAVLKEP
jgi:hypothetical protein